MSETSLVQAVRNFIEQVEAAEKGAKNRGGQHVPYHGDFASATPSTRRELDWWRRYFLAELATPASFDPATALECARLVCGECRRGAMVERIGGQDDEHAYGHPATIAGGLIGYCWASPIHARLAKEGK